MKIALCAHNLSNGGGITVGRSITSILPKLAPSSEFAITVPADCGYDALKDYRNVKLFELNSRSFVARLKFERRFATFLNRRGCDWCWALGNNLAFFPKSPLSTLLHSAYFLNYPFAELGLAAFRSRPKLRLAAFLVRRTIARSRRVYGQTETVCRRIAETYRLPPERVSLCETGGVLDAIPQDDAANDDFRRRVAADFSDKFRLVYVSSFYPHKNVARIVETFVRFRAELRDVACFLTFSPDLNDETRALARRVADAGLERAVVFLGTVPHSRLAALYRSVDACLFPSTLETVGLGLLEAARFGLPTIASDLDFAREACGDAALFVDPTSPEAIFGAILRLKNDATLRETLRAKGFERSRRRSKSYEEILTNVLRLEGVPVE